MKNPIQPLYTDKHDNLRFKENEIVRRLVDEGSIDLNQIALWDVSVDDREQLAQLIGYSHSGFGTLSYVTDETYEAAVRINDGEVSGLQSRYDALSNELSEIKKVLKSINDLTEDFNLEDS